jgi:hypothetical protein
MPVLDKPYGATLKQVCWERIHSSVAASAASRSGCFATRLRVDSDEEMTGSQCRVWNSHGILNPNKSWRHDRILPSSVDGRLKNPSTTFMLRLTVTARGASGGQAESYTA